MKSNWLLACIAIVIFLMYLNLLILSGSLLWDGTGQNRIWWAKLVILSTVLWTLGWIVLIVKTIKRKGV